MFTFMTMWWFWSVLALLLFLPVGYGWGYRGWGVPYPSYIQRRRMEQATRAGATGSVDHRAWGWGGDLVWALIAIDLLFVIGLFWRR
jgi:hypothetical protein